MLETCAHFWTMSAADLASLLTRYVTFVRATGNHPEAGPAVAVAKIMTFTDTVVAPPPPPCEFPWRPAGRPGTRGSDDEAGEGLLAMTHSPASS